MKKVLIFGGSGQIGRHLIRKLTKKNYLVTVVTRNLHKKGNILKLSGNPGYVEVIEGNVFDEEQFLWHPFDAYKPGWDHRAGCSGLV